MPEGDSVKRVAVRLHARLSGLRVVRSSFRHPKAATVDLAGTTILETVSRGKHLLTRFDDGRTLHTHLRMDGEWTVLGPGKHLPRRLDPDVRVLLDTGPDGPTGIGLRLPVVEVLPTRDEADVVGHLGPDLLGDDWDAAEAERRLLLRPDRPIKAALLDQRNLAGIGNMWADELCFLRGLHPDRPVGTVDLPRALALAHRMLRFSVSPGGAAQVTTGDTRRGEQHWVTGRANRPCRRCGTTVLVVPEVPGDPERRRTWWCPSCQPELPGQPPGHLSGSA
ncbi:DNA-formamidopyrimidine glycosylase family protein [Angustibacter aerolatus]